MSRDRTGILTIALHSIAALALLDVNPVLAQSSAMSVSTSSATGALDEIVVTAQKRSESIQSVPMAITAFSGQNLIASGVSTFQDYAVQVPNVAFAYSGGSGVFSSQTIGIRGIYGQNTTAMYIDDTPLPESIDPHVLDLNRIEVLKGPQGTLYGARSMGGTVRLITNDPDLLEESGYVHGTGSYTDHGGGNGLLESALNVPLISNTVAIRVNGYYEEESGFLTRMPSLDAPVDYGPQSRINSVDRAGGAVSAKLNLLDDRLVISPRVMVEHVFEANHTYADYSAENLVQYRLFNLNEPGSDLWQLYSLTAKYKTWLGELTSDTSQFVRRSTDSEDESEAFQAIFGTPATAALIHQQLDDHDFSQELRFTSEFSGPFQVTAGAFYQRSAELNRYPFTPDGIYIDDVFDAHVDTVVTEGAVFSEINYALTAKLKLIAGARWFDNTVKSDGSEGGVAVTPGIFSGKQHQNGVNPKFGLQYQFTADDQVYVTAAKGFRIGGINIFAASLCAADLDALHLTANRASTYASDSLWSYEIGAKTTWLDHRLTVNAAIFDIEWSGIQQPVALPDCGYSILVNNGAARSRGGELEIQAAVAASTRISFGTGYTDARITDSGASDIVPVGTRIQQVPKWTSHAALDYTLDALPLSPFLHGEYDLVGASFSANNSVTGLYPRPEYSLVNLRAGCHLDGWQLTVFADNVFDKRADFSDSVDLGIGLPGRPRVSINRPRTVGLDARLRF